MTRRDFGRYKIAEEVGRGAMGVVYRALDPVVARTVAIKAINATYLEGVGVKAAEYFERFRREAEVAGRLNHPNIVKIYDLGADYLVMEFVEGQSLASMLQAKIRLAPERILDLLTQVAEALDYAHEQGIVHRDVKPANIMIQPDGVPKVMDFGLARIESSTLTAAGEILGSASYMAPEVVLGRPAVAASDIFSLGVVAYEMMTGRRPFGGASITVIIQNIVRTSPRPAHDVNLHLPPEDDAIFERVLAKEPGTRYGSAVEFATALALRTWEEPSPHSSPRTAETLVDADPDATIPPEARAVAAGATTVLMAAGSEAAAAAPEDDDGGRTVVTVEADEVAAMTLPPAGDPEEIPATSLEPIEEEAPLGSLIETRPPAATTLASASTETQRTGATIDALARRAAAGGLGASDVLEGEAQTVIMGPTPVPPAPERGPAAAAPQTVGRPAPSTAPPAPPAPRPPGAPPEAAPTGPARAVPPAPTKKGVPLALVLGVVMLVLLAITGALSYLAYRWLVRRAATVSALPAPETTLTAPLTTPREQAAVEPPPTTPPTTLAEAQPVPETMATATTAPATAALSITSEPPGARVSIGKKMHGTTPLRLRLAPGRLSVSVEKDGFKPWKYEAALTAGGLSLEARLEPLPRETAAPKPVPTPAGVKAGDLVPLGPDVTPPRKLSGKSPELPRAAAKLKLSGSVLVEFVVDEEGRVSDPKVVDSAGEMLDAPCVDAVRSWRYEPASTQGVKVKVVQRAKFTFQSR